MADKKISQLTALSAANVASATDVLAIVDTSATETKKITAKDLIDGALNGGTANGVLYLNGSKVATSGSALTFDGTKLGVGTATPGAVLDLVGTASGVTNNFRLTSYQFQNAFMLLNMPNNGTYRSFEFQEAGSTTAYLRQYGSAYGSGINSVVRLGNGSATLDFDAAGNLGLGVTPVDANNACLQLKSGITFPATQSASGNSNTLDDYEEGTFTPTVAGSTVSGTGTYTSQVGRYVKIGKSVTAQVYLNWTAHTGTGNLTFAGLPFFSVNVTNAYSAVSIGYISNIALTANNVTYAYLNFNSTVITVTQTQTGGSASTVVPMDTAGEVIYTVTYEASS